MWSRGKGDAIPLHAVLDAPPCGRGNSLERGTDLRYIQELLGHAHSKRAEIYTYVSTKSIGKIRSPLDNLNLEKGGGE